jgi:hypothetical protein
VGFVAMLAAADAYLANILDTTLQPGVGLRVIWTEFSSNSLSSVSFAWQVPLTDRQWS